MSRAHPRPVQDVIDAVDQGHAGLGTLLGSMLSEGLAGEPRDAPARALVYLNELDVRGELAWRLYAEACGRDRRLFFRVILGVSLGALTPAGLRIAITDNLLDAAAIERYSLRIEAVLRQHARKIAEGLPARPQTLLPIGGAEELGLLFHFFGPPPATAGHDDKES